MRRRLGADGLRAVPATAGGARGLDGQLFEVITAQLREKAITIKTGTLVEATIIASASKDDDEGRWVKHKGKPAIRGFKAHIGADAGTALVEKIFGTWKRSCGLRRMRWRGLAKATAQVHFTAIACNPKPTLNILATAA